MNDAKTMEERFDETFLIRSAFGNCIADPDGMANERIKQFLKSELSSLLKAVLDKKQFRRSEYTESQIGYVLASDVIGVARERGVEI